MTTTQQTSVSTTPPAGAAPPLSRAARLAAGASLVLAGLLNGGAQYIGHLVSDDAGEWIRWAAEHPTWAAVEQWSTLVSLLVLPIGILGIAQVTRWRRPRLTAVATVLSLWGMWGFHTVLGLWYASGGVAPEALGVEAAVRLDDAYGSDPGVIALALVPHLLGSFLGLLLLCVAARGTFPTPALVLLAAFLVWDFLGVPVGPLEAHLLLAVALAWLGLHLLRMPAAQWHGARASGL
ncbi:MAG TPA: hypothetical protein VLQ78_06770 [Ornithinibacter sp.]|nr:hypothetical protein [Ornithinibacter sp.]